MKQNQINGYETTLTYSTTTTKTKTTTVVVVIIVSLRNLDKYTST